MALSRMHTSAKAIDTAKFLLVNKCQMKHMVRWCCVIPHDTDVWLDPVGYNIDPTLTIIYIYKPPGTRYKLLCRIWLLEVNWIGSTQWDPSKCETLALAHGQGVLMT